MPTDPTKFSPDPEGPEVGQIARWDGEQWVHMTTNQTLSYLIKVLAARWEALPEGIARHEGISTPYDGKEVELGTTPKALKGQAVYQASMYYMLNEVPFPPTSPYFNPDDPAARRMIASQADPVKPEGWDQKADPGVDLPFQPGDVVRIKDKTDSNYDREGPVYGYQGESGGDIDPIVWFEDHRKVYREDQVEKTGDKIGDAVFNLPETPLVNPPAKG